MSLIYRHTNGGELYQAGAREIPEILRENNISLLILAAKNYQPNYIEDTGGGFEAADVLYVPLRDTILFTPREYKKTIKKAKQAAELAIEHILRGDNVLSTCWAGWNRSGLISGLAIRKLSNEPGKKIVNHIRKNRSKSALSNPLFARVVANS
jgi:hypothetical protein